jgi:DNA transformation protein
LIPVADDSFKEFVLDQLSALPDVRAKAMFGAHGIYSGETFFGILDEGRLFFKTDAASQADYTTRGMGPFTDESRGNVLTMSYHEVPPDVLKMRRNSRPGRSGRSRWPPVPRNPPGGQNGVERMAGVALPT